VTIRKGEPWGESVAAPAGLEIFADDRAVSRSVADRFGGGVPLAEVGVRGGDMARTLGGGGAGRFEGHVVRAPIDLLRVQADGHEHWAFAHVVLRRSWWRGEVVLAMNAQFLGPFDVAPRSHPNDGRVDVLRVDPSMGVRTRLQARRRARTGVHVPHPQLSLRSSAEWQGAFDRPIGLWIDGEHVADVRAVNVVVQPDALIVHA